jgi:hypothetical protein
MLLFSRGFSVRIAYPLYFFWFTHIPSSTPLKILSSFADHFSSPDFPVLFPDSPFWPLQDYPKMTLGDYVYQ